MNASVDDGGLGGAEFLKTVKLGTKVTQEHHDAHRDVWNKESSMNELRRSPLNKESSRSFGRRFTHFSSDKWKMATSAASSTNLAHQLLDKKERIMKSWNLIAPKIKIVQHPHSFTLACTALNLRTPTPMTRSLHEKISLTSTCTCMRTRADVHLFTASCGLGVCDQC